jgi:riboflavin transport system substrate-binding protein
MKSRISLASIVLFFILAPVAGLFATPVNVGIYIPGVTAGSPLYQSLVDAAQKVANELPEVSIKVLEGGFNQAEWPEKVTSMVATSQYDYILTSNPSMPSICLEASKSFPNQRFIIMDSYLAPGNTRFYTLLYNQVEQGYIAGYLAGLVTTSGMSGANSAKKIGAIVAQEYPALSREIIPGFSKGAQAIDSKINIDYRVIGNWYDANKASDLANSMIDGGVDVILSIAGGASQGIIKAAQARGKYVICFDSDVYSIAPGTIIGCVTLDQGRAVYESLKKAIQGKLAFGTADFVSVKDGFVDLADANPIYSKNVSADVRLKMAEMMKKFRSGGFSLPIPQM